MTKSSPRHSPERRSSTATASSTLWGTEILVTAAISKETNEIQGAISLEFDPETNVCCVSWAATRPGLRDSGVFTALFAQSHPYWLKKLWPTPLVAIEVENPLTVESSPIHGDPFARLRLYDRIGIKALNLPFYQPPQREGGERLFNMMLVLFLDHGGPVGERVRAADVLTYVRWSHRGEEGRPEYERLIQAILDAGEFIPTIPLTVDPHELPCGPGAIS